MNNLESVISLVAQISREDALGGGSNRVAEELVVGLRSRGIGCEHWMKTCRIGFDDNERFYLYREHPRLFPRIWSRLKQLGFPELLPLELGGLLKRDANVHYDLFHFHDLSGSISPATLRLLARKRPVVWTFHDCSPFTGGCITHIGCEKFRKGCGKCPQLGRWPLNVRHDFTRILQNEKRKLYFEGNVVTIAPSLYMAEEAMASGLLRERPRIIPNGVDVKTFHPRDKDSAKAFLGIAKDRVVVLIAATSLGNREKGAGFAVEAIRSVSEFRPFVIVVGRVDEEFKMLLQGLDYISTGFLSSLKMLSFWYSMADLLVFCSLSENMPLSVLETMACGVSMVGFRTGGIPEMIEQDVTGFLVPQKDMGALAEAMRHAFDDRRYARWGVNARRRAEELYSMQKFIENHLSLYREVVEKHAAQNR